jgi:opacity protein-like surface antigen
VSSAHHWSTGPLLGAGVGYDLTRNVALRAEWDRYFRVGDASTGRGDIDQYTVGVAYRF